MQHLLFNTFKKFNYPSMILKHISFFFNQRVCIAKAFNLRKGSLFHKIKSSFGIVVRKQLYTLTSEHEQVHVTCISNNRTP